MKDLKSQRLYLQVYDGIKGCIEKNHLLPGDRLPSEMRMCRMLGVSRNVLREAIKSLEITGVIHSTPGADIMIQEFNTGSFLSNLIYSISDEDQLHKEIKELRHVLELGFAEDAFGRMTERGIALLSEKVVTVGELFNQIKRSHSSVYGVKFAKTDAAFHKILFQSMDGRLLKSAIEFFWACGQYYRVKAIHSNMELTVEKRQRICRTLKASSYSDLYDAMQSHFNMGCFER